MSDYSEDEIEPGVLVAAKEAVLRPIYFATSKPARRAYLSTALFILTSLFLLGCAITAYILFYFSYIPARGFSRPIYLQFGPDHPPYGLVTLSRELVSNQRYDVRIVLNMPRTPSNTEAGNFMLNLQLLAPGPTGSSWSSTSGEILVQETRPSILKYHSLSMDHVHKAAALPLYLLGLKEEAEELDVTIMEGIEFARGWRNIPAMARLELQGEKQLQVYNARIVINARLHGLRYMMYNFRIISFFTLTCAFWIVEMTFVAMVWLGLSIFIFPNESPPIMKDEKAPIKQEGGEQDSDALSDTPRTFPTRSGQPPLKYASPRVKSEEEEETPLTDPHPLTGEADDEDDEDADFLLDEAGPIGRGVSDSGIGTSMESSGGRKDSIRRRNSRPSG